MTFFPHTIFVAGTDTEVGKTFVSAVLTLGLQASYWKPIQCGVSPCTDTEWVHDATGLPQTHFLPESYRFGEPTSPHAQHTGVEISSIRPNRRLNPHGHLIIEGSGGVMVPLNEKEFVIDFIQSIGAPTLLVAKNTKGAVNQVILTMEKLQEREIPIFGVVLNGPKNPLNRSAVEEYCSPPRIFEIDFIHNITHNTLMEVFKEAFSPCVSYGHCI